MEYDELLRKIMSSKKTTNGIRFTPPAVDIEQSGQRTTITLDKLANYINRPIDHLAKYLMHELTSSGQMEGGKLILAGRFSRNLINEKINGYINEYVICKQCKSPDTQLVKEEKNYFIKCMACGAEYPVGRIK